MTRALVVALALPLAAHAQGERTFSIKGLELGAPRAQVLEQIRGLECEGPKCFASPKLCRGKTEVDIQACRQALSYGGAETEQWHARFDEADRLVWLFVTFHERDYASITEALIERFGKPEIDRVENYEGLPTRRLVWITPTTVFMARQRGGAKRPETASVSLNSVPDMERARQKQKQDRAKDL